MPISSNASYVYKLLAASGTVKSGPGVLRSIFVSAIGVTPTITVYNNTAASGDVIIATFTPIASGSYVFEAAFDVGCYIALSNVTNCTALYV